MEDLGKCRSDYPRPDSVVSVSVGRRQILFKYKQEVRVSNKLSTLSWLGKIFPITKEDLSVLSIESF